MRTAIRAGSVIASLALLASVARGADAAPGGARDASVAAPPAAKVEKKEPVALASPATAPGIPAEAALGGAGAAAVPAAATPIATASVPAGATRDDVDGVRDEVQVLRDQWQRSLDRNVAQALRALNVGGSAQTRFLQTEERGTPNTFGINSVLLTFKGNLKKDYEEGRNLDYALAFSAGSDFTAKPNDANLTYALLGTLDKEGWRLGVTAGQQKKPFSLEASTTEEYKPTIRGAQFVTPLKLDERDIGVVVSGDLFPHVDYAFNYRVPLIAYSFGVVSGAGPNKSDDNNTKDFVGRVVLSAPVDWSNFFRGLQLGGSLYVGRQTATATQTNNTQVSLTDAGGKSVTVTTKTTSTKVTELGPKKRWGADLAYVNTPVGFTVEYAQGEDEVKVSDGVLNNTTVKSAVGFDTVRSEGYTATVFYNFGDQFVKAIKGQDRYDDWYPLTYQPFVRFDRLVPNLDQRSVHTDVWTFGFNWFFAQTTKLQVNYNLKVESPKTYNDELLVQFQFGF